MPFPSVIPSAAPTGKLSIRKCLARSRGTPTDCPLAHAATGSSPLALSHTSFVRGHLPTRQSGENSLNLHVRTDADSGSLHSAPQSPLGRIVFRRSGRDDRGGDLVRRDAIPSQGCNFKSSTECI